MEFDPHSAQEQTVIGAQARLAEWAFRRRERGGVSRDEREKLAMLLRDYLACVFAGANTDLGRRAQEAFPSGGGSCTLIGSRQRVDPSAASFLNGFAGHVLDYDDVHAQSILHAGVPIFASLIATSEATDLQADSLAIGALVGYEIAIRLGRAAGPDHYARHHTTGTVMGIAAAAAVATAMGGTPSEISSAMGLAATQAAGLWAFSGGKPDSKPLHTAHAAWTGLISAKLALRGLAGATAALEGKRGFLATLGGDPACPALLPPTDRDVLSIFDVSIKPYPCCGHALPGLLAARQLHAEASPVGGLSNKIVSGTLHTYEVATVVAGRRRPSTASEAAFSYAWLVAYMLIHGDLNSAFVEGKPSEGVNDPAVASLEARLTVLSDEAMSRQYPERQPVTLTLGLKDGRIISEAAHFGLGSPQRPLSRESHRAKLLELCRGDIAWMEPVVRRMIGGQA